ncbi:MAG: hypothetical protein CME62_09525 [Halobacteriovoraceae bacterium]|nr:hypothetical protein [Halobacteriovoraceae bacterium]
MHFVFLLSSLLLRNSFRSLSDVRNCKFNFKKVTMNKIENLQILIPCKGFYMCRPLLNFELNLFGLLLKDIFTLALLIIFGKKNNYCM